MVTNNTANTATAADLPTAPVIPASGTAMTATETERQCPAAASQLSQHHANLFNGNGLQRAKKLPELAVAAAHQPVGPPINTNNNGLTYPNPTAPGRLHNRVRKLWHAASNAVLKPRPDNLPSDPLIRSDRWKAKRRFITAIA